MDYLLKAATIIDPYSAHHRQVRDIGLRDGRIYQISTAMEAGQAETVLDLTGTYCSPGWVDLRAQLGDPGLEHLEDLISGTQAAAAGGYTHVGVLPNTAPPISHKAQVAYLATRAKALPTALVPLATFRKPENPDELTEMRELAEAGVRGFTQGDEPVADAGFLKRALQYSCNLGAPVMLHPQHPSLHEEGDMNEGLTSIQLGLAGTPAMAEHIAIQQHIELCRYTAAHVHFSKVTTARSVRLIAAAKQEGLPITCDTGILHLIYHEQHILEYGYPTNLKLSPPLRTPEDRAALREGVTDGTIDVLIADHQPVRSEDKECEFPLAEPGSIGLQTSFPLLLQALGHDRFLDQGIAALTARPRQVLGLDAVTIEEGAVADLTYFSPTATWTLDASTNYSRSRNSMLYGESMQGLVYGTFRAGHPYTPAQLQAERP